MRKKSLPGLIGCMLLLYSVASGQSLQKITVKGGVMMQGEKEISVSSFSITKYEINNQQYASFLNAEEIGMDGMCNGMELVNVISADLQLEFMPGKWRPKQGKENYPMVMVSYYGAEEYAKWMKGRLPSETEWYYAAKGGIASKNYSYAGGNELEEVGWYKGNSGQHSHAVGEKKANELGIFDMSGNAWEWCRNDTLKTASDFCVHMGGSWFAGEQPSRLSAHYGNTPTHFSNSVGFRVIFTNSKKKK